MELGTNVLVPQKKPSRYAVLSASVAGVVIAATVVSAAAFALGYPGLAQAAAFGQLCFPLSIIWGHLARRQIRANPSVYTGEAWATAGLMVGYFNLIIVTLIITLVIVGSR